jgi:peptide/nickel transport system substrate-binding protein
MKRLTLSVAVWSLTCSIVLVSIASPSRASTSPSPAGGTLRLAMLNDAEQNLDPDKEYLPSTWELFRCCLLRTLLSYNGQPSENAGADLFPDLADGMPTVSADGMTWTFHIKHGIHYAPPFSDVEVTAGDFVRALNREADPIASASPGYPVYYKPIVGFDEARTFDEANTPAIATVSGLEIPDRYTFVVRLNEPTGDLGYRFSLPATAPIPPSPVDQSYPDGAAHGLEADYGHHIVSTGPYMLEGSGQLDFSKQPAYLRPEA